MSAATRWGFHLVWIPERRVARVVWNHPAEHRKPHPPIKPNRRRTHRRRS